MFPLEVTHLYCMVLWRWVAVSMKCIHTVLFIYSLSTCISQLRIQFININGMHIYFSVYQISKQWFSLENKPQVGGDRTILFTLALIFKIYWRTLITHHYIILFYSHFKISNFIKIMFWKISLIHFFRKYTFMYRQNYAWGRYIIFVLYFISSLQVWLSNNRGPLKKYPFLNYDSSTIYSCVLSNCKYKKIISFTKQENA